MADDEEVVFKDSMLYEHLKETGFCDGDIDAETFSESRNAEDDSGSSKQQKEYSSNSASNEDFPFSEEPPKKSIKTKLTSALISYLWDDSKKEVNQLHHKEAENLTDAVLQCPLLEDEDAAYIDSFAATLDYHPKSDELEESDGMMTQVITQMGILGISLAYGCFRMLYMKSSDADSQFYVWVLDIFAVLLTVMCLMPFTMRFAWAGRLIRKLRTFSRLSRTLVASVSQWDKTSRRTIRLIQEMELVARGFTLVTSLTPVVRMESNGLTLRQCPELRRSAFLTARKVMLDFKAGTKKLLAKFPSHVELEGISNYLANAPLQDYGDCVNLEPGPELHKITDGYCLSALKQIISLCNTHISEFLRVLTLACMLRPEENFQNIGFVDQLDVVKSALDRLTDCLTPLHRLYCLHKCMNDRAEEKETSQGRSPLQQTQVGAIYIAIHSLNLHLQAALRRVQRSDEKLFNLENENTLPPAMGPELLSDLKMMSSELEACKDCLEEGVTRVNKAMGVKGPASAPKDPENQENEAPEESNKPPPIPLNDIEVIIKDQVFEAYTDPNEVDLTEGDGSIMTDEEKAQHKAAQQDAMRMLKELQSVIAVRAADTKERERKALQEMGIVEEEETQPPPTKVPPMTDDNTNIPCCMKMEQKTDPGTESEEEIPLPTKSMDELRLKLSGIAAGSSLAFSRDVAALAAARGQSFAPSAEETFGGEGEMESSESHESDADW